MITFALQLRSTFFVFFFTYFSLSGQKEQQLTQRLKSCKSDSIKCLILVELRDENFDYFKLTQFDSTYYAISKKCYLNSKNSSRKKYFSFHYAESLRRIVNVGMAYGKTSTRDLTKLNYIIALYNVSEKPKFIAAAYLEKGYYFYCNSDFKNALVNYQHGLRIAESVKADYEIALGLNNIASLHNDVKNYPLSLNYYKLCLEKIKNGNDTYAITTVLGNIGLTHYKLKDYSSAEFFLKKSIDLAKKSADIVNEQRALCLLGDVFLETKKHQLAFSSYNRGLEISKKENFTTGVANAQFRLSTYWFTKGDLKQAIIFGESAYKLAVSTEDQELVRNIIEGLIQVHKAAKDFKRVIDLIEIFETITNSIHSDETENRLLQSKYAYEYDKKAISDSLLLAQEKQVYSLQIEKDRNLKIYLVIFILFALIFTFLIFKRYRISQKQNSVIEQNNRDLERQHLMNQKIFSVISHDFRGPMLSLQYLLQSLQTSSTNTSMNQLIKEVNSEVGNATEILENLLNWARTEIGMNHFKDHNCMVQQIFEEVEKEFTLKMSLKQLRIKSKIQNINIDLPADILRIVLRNLLSNAYKFSYENSVILIEFKDDVLVVQDQGKGMPQEKMDKLFRQEIDTELGTNNEEGFGIGLYIVAELLNKYAYQIHVQSEENEGARFTISKK